MRTKKRFHGTDPSMLSTKPEEALHASDEISSDAFPITKQRYSGLSRVEIDFFPTECLPSTR